MIQNKQVSIWRGHDAPPTLYHLWFKDETQLLRYDEIAQDWVVFLDGTYINQTISEFLEQLQNFSINGQPISSNPVLDGTDIKITFDGNYVNSDNTISEAIQIIDSLLTTKVYGE